MGRVYKVCLVACVVLLTVIALSLTLKPPVAHAANQYKYSVVYGGGSQADAQKAMDTQANDGWEFVSPIVYTTNGGTVLLVFRKER